MEFLLLVFKARTYIKSGHKKCNLFALEYILENLNLAKKTKKREKDFLVELAASQHDNTPCTALHTTSEK